MPRSSEFDFREQHVVVTGGSNGIGLAIAEAFKNAQASVIITGTKQVSNDYDHDLSGFDYRSLDTGDAEAVSAFADSVDVVDVLVNCAGTALGPMEYQVDGWQRIIDVNLTGSMRLATDLLDKLSDRQGVVINIASMSSYAGFPHAPAYGASKTAIVSLTKSLAIAWADRGVRVNAIAPGWVDTNLTQGTQADAHRNAAIVARTPLDRWAQPEEMTGAVLFLCSDAAGFITGVTLPVDGGFSAA